MLIGEFIQTATKKLTNAGISTGRLDVLVLLEDATGKDRSWLIAHPEYLCQGRSLTHVNEWVGRRVRHEPLAYIRGVSEFYGREFMVSRDTLEPRPETETMIELAKKVLGARFEVLEEEKSFRIVDVGTGSGAVAITMKLEMPELEVVGVDISDKCIKVAAKNAKKLNAEVTFSAGNLLEPIYNLEPITSNLSAILANLPYVPNSHTINQAAMHEPKLAIFGGHDGLDLYRELFDQIKLLDLRPQYVFTESLPFQHAELAKIAELSGYYLQKTTDFIQVFVADTKLQIPNSKEVTK